MIIVNIHWYILTFNFLQEDEDSLYGYGGRLFHTVRCKVFCRIVHVDCGVGGWARWWYLKYRTF